MDLRIADFLQTMEHIAMVTFSMGNSNETHHKQDYMVYEFEKHYETLRIFHSILYVLICQLKISEVS